MEEHMKFTFTYFIILFSSIAFTQDVHIVCHDEECPPNTGFHFRTIQDAINSTCEEDENGEVDPNCVDDGDTILVEPGTYYENLIIQRDLNIISRF